MSLLWWLLVATNNYTEILLLMLKAITNYFISLSLGFPMYKLRPLPSALCAWPYEIKCSHEIKWDSAGRVSSIVSWTTGNSKTVFYHIPSVLIKTPQDEWVLALTQQQLCCKMNLYSYFDSWELLIHFQSIN